jgi:uncharacterized protein YkwD
VLLTAPAAPEPPRPLEPPEPRVPARRAGKLLAAIGAVVALAPALVLVAGPASASSDPANSLVAATNQARGVAGVSSLSVSGDLVAAATRQAQNMAASGLLYHTPGLSSAICCWVVVGENVGEGPSAARLQAAFMASPEHRANILRTSFTQIGVGYAVDRRGTLWVSEIFRRPSGSVTVVTPAAVVRPQTRSTPPAVAKPAVKAAVPVAVRPPVAAVVAPVVAPVPALPAPDGARAVEPVSRDLVRLPLTAGLRLAAQLGDGAVVTGTNPVSRLLDFAAVASGTEG